MCTFYHALGKSKRVILEILRPFMLDSDGYRPNVGIILTNDDKKVFWAKRLKKPAWQFPQGGIDPHHHGAPG